MLQQGPPNPVVLWRYMGRTKAEREILTPVTPKKELTADLYA
jgi:hypothetical protein